MYRLVHIRLPRISSTWRAGTMILHSTTSSLILLTMTLSDITHILLWLQNSLTWSAISFNDWPCLRSMFRRYDSSDCSNFLPVSIEDPFLCAAGFCWFPCFLCITVLKPSASVSRSLFCRAWLPDETSPHVLFVTSASFGLGGTLCSWLATRQHLSRYHY